MFRFLIAALAALAAWASAAAAAPVSTGHVKLELAPQSATVQPGKRTFVALRQVIAPGWHTYWINAGDAGQAPEIAWTLPSGWKAGPIQWPTPHRLPQPPLMTYGYEGEVLLPVAIDVPAGAKPGDRAHLDAKVSLLVCADVCIPESGEVTLDLPIAAGQAEPHPEFGAAVARAVAAVPAPAPFQAVYQVVGGQLKLAATGGPLKGADAAGAYFFPATARVADYSTPQTIERGPDGLTLTLTRPKEGVTSGPISGVLQTRAGAWTVTASPGPLPPGSSGLGSAAHASVGAAPATAAAPVPAGPGLALAVLFGLVGGLLLNLMPCVFPVLAMKAAALAKGAHGPREARRDGLAYLAGTVACFLALAGVLIAAKAGGQAIGWGFQLQSPAVTAFLSLLMLSVGLNLSGLFEAGSSLQGLGVGLNGRGGAVGAFLTGVLAVVVGAPCTAPFMAAALGWALAAGAAQTLVVFLALGLGLALPFVALSFSPGLLSRLPRPGPWMESLRRYLAYPMYATTAFLVWVFAQQSGSAALAGLMGAGVLTILALQLFGRAQRRRAEGASAFASLVCAGLALFLAALAGVWAATEPAPAQAASGQKADQAWSPERQAEALAEGRPVFVNFTAAWCVTCKVNERSSLASHAVTEAMARTNTAYLVADWTRRDDAIAAALAAQGRSGVPLYLVFRPGDAKPEVLPQILTPGAVVGALERAAK